MFCVYQPTLFPPIYLINRFISCSKVVIIPDVQFSRPSYQNSIKLYTGSTNLVCTLPVHHKSTSLISEVSPCNLGFFVKKFKKTVQTIYGSYEGFKGLQKDFFRFLDTLVSESETRPMFLDEIAIESLYWVMEALSLGTRSIMCLRGLANFDKNERLVHASVLVGDKHYLAGGSGFESYMSKSTFLDHGIKVSVQNYCMPRYKYCNGDSSVSILDPLFTLGVTETLKLVFHI